MYLKKIFLTVNILFCSIFFLLGQKSALPLNNVSYHIIDRLDIKSGIESDINSSLKPYSRKSIIDFALKVDSTNQNLSVLDQYDLTYLYKDNNEFFDSSNPENDPLYYSNRKTFLKHFYKTPANFFEVNHPSFYLRVNPIIHFQLDRNLGEDDFLFNNLRGIEIRGGVDDKIFFYTNLLESQAKFPRYINDFILKNEAIPQNGKFRKYTSSIFDSSNSYDLLNSQAFIQFNLTKHVGMQLGHGSNFIGNGYRSLLLSDFAQNYFYLKMNWKVWKFQYQNVFAELNAISANQNDLSSTPVPKKYFAAHYLNFNISKNLSVGIFETIIFNRDSEVGHFELQYLNPVIFYRTAEIYLDSPDNVLLGLEAKWNFLKRYQLYGQFLFDTFKFNEWIVNDQDWWGKKYGAQIGLKYIDVLGIDHLDFQGEINVARPYLYAHRDTSGASYSHNNTPLAHPLGANFYEYIFIARYQPFAKWSAQAKFIKSTQGEDENGSNWGSDILLSYYTREKDFNNDITQGLKANNLFIGLEISYQPWHNVFFSLQYLQRDRSSLINSYSEKYLGISTRINIGKPNMDF